MYIEIIRIDSTFLRPPKMQMIPGYAQTVQCPYQFSRLAPRSNSAPTVISPLIPDAQSRYKIFSSIFTSPSTFLILLIHFRFSLLCNYHKPLSLCRLLRLPHRQAVDLRRQICCAVAVIYIYNRNAVRTGINHRDQCRQSMKTCTIADRGRNRNDRIFHQPGDNCAKRAFHSRHCNHAICPRNRLAFG